MRLFQLKNDLAERNFKFVCSLIVYFSWLVRVLICNNRLKIIVLAMSALLAPLRQQWQGHNVLFIYLLILIFVIVAYKTAYKMVTIKYTYIHN